MNMCSYSQMVSDKASLNTAIKIIKNIVSSQGITIYEAVEMTIDDKAFADKVIGNILEEYGYF